MPLITVMMLDSHLWLLFPKSPSVLLSYQQCQWWPASFLFPQQHLSGHVVSAHRDMSHLICCPGALSSASVPLFLCSSP